MTSTTEEIPTCPVCAASPERCDCLVDVVDPTPEDRREMAALALEHAGENALAQIVRAWSSLAAPSQRAVSHLAQKLREDLWPGGGA